MNFAVKDTCMRWAATKRLADFGDNGPAMVNAYRRRTDTDKRARYEERQQSLAAQHGTAATAIVIE